jgi:hypothetical protein
MTEYVIIAVITTAGLALALIRLSLKTFVKSSVQESIKHEFEVQRQQMREEFERQQNALERKDRFRLAALEKRIEAHQRAFALARKMHFNLHNSESEPRRETSRECEAFFDTYAVYLTNEARDAFWKALTRFSYFHYQVRTLEANRGNPANYDRTFREIEEVENMLASLPGKIIGIIDKESSGEADFTLPEAKPGEAER